MKTICLEGLVTVDYDIFCKLNATKSETCWVWNGSKDKAGYGRVLLKGKMLFAHRVAWQLVHGNTHQGLCVCHHCDNPACVRIDHLFLGTIGENIQDAARKGRLKGPHGPMPEEEKQKRSAALLGRKLAPHVRRAISLANARRVVSEGTRMKMSEIAKAKPRANGKFSANVKRQECAR